MGETVWYLGRVALRLRTAQEYRYNLKLNIYFTFKTFFSILYTIKFINKFDIYVRRNIQLKFKEI